MKDINIQEIARRARVSTATVSRVINNQPGVRPVTRDRVLSVVNKLHYRPNPLAQGLSRARPRVIGVVTHPKPDLKAHYFVETLRGVKHALSETSYSLVVNPSDEAVSGYLLLAPAENDPVLKRAAQRGIPTVLVNSPSDAFSWVDLDNVAAAAEAVGHLLQLGHRRVAIINGKLETANGKHRFDGYKKALREHDVPFDPQLVAEGRFDQAQGFAAMKRLLGLKDRPTAVFAANDYMAIGAIKAAQDAGLRVPQDLAVAGFDDVDASSCVEPPLTTVRQPLFEMGFEGGRFLSDAVSGRHNGAQQRRILVQGKLIIRKSCGAYVRPTPTKA